MSDDKCQNCQHAKRLSKWESELSKVMPPDFKDWWQNSRDEWPEVARRTIEALKAREADAWANVERLQGLLGQIVRVDDAVIRGENAESEIQRRLTLAVDIATNALDNGAK